MYPPNDRRNFVHKRIIGAVGGFLGGGPVGAVGGFVGGGGRGGRRSGGQPLSERSLAFRSRPCAGPNRERINGVCREKVGGVRATLERAIPFGATGFTGAGDVVNGRYGPAYEPMADPRVVRLCLPGDILGDDGLCYSKAQLKNKEREYPRGTRPLGTPGEMAALRKAAAFGRRMETTVKRMQSIGVLKKPSKARRPMPRQRQIGPGGPSIINVE